MRTSSSRSLGAAVPTGRGSGLHPVLPATLAALLLLPLGSWKLAGQAVEDGLGAGEGRVTDPPAGRWFPATSPMPPPLAAPRAPSLRGAVIRTERDHSRHGAHLPDDPGDDPFVLGDFQGSNLEAEAALGHRLPIFLLRRGEGRPGAPPGEDGAARRSEGAGPAVTLEFAAAVVSRFFLETRQNDLINTDYRVGFPITATWRGWQGMLELRHVSSHVGDDFAARFGVADREVSLDGLELLLARKMANGLRAYAGGEWNLRTARGMETAAGRLGLEYDPGIGQPGRRSWPFAALDLRVNDQARRAEVSAVAGLALRFRGVGLRFEATGYHGPSAMGWMRSADETYWGLGIRLAPGGL